MVIVYCTEPEVAILEDQVDLQQQDAATWRKQWPPPGRGGPPGVGCGGGGLKPSKCLNHHNQWLCKIFLAGVNLKLPTYSVLL